MIVREIRGNLLNTDLNYIAHGVNCQNVMGSGVARAIYLKYSTVKSSYHSHCTLLSCSQKPKELLGSVQKVAINNGKIVFNCFTQEYYGSDGKKYVDYQAIKKCFDFLTNQCNNVNAIAIPKIGCGLAGGDWEIVKEIINQSTQDKLDVYVYYI